MPSTRLKLMPSLTCLYCAAVSST